MNVSARRRRSLHVYGVAGIVMLMVGVLGSGSGIGAERPEIAVIDPQAVLEHSKAGQRALGTLKEHATIRQKLLARDEEELKKMEAELKESLEKLSESERQARQEQFRKKVQEYQQRVQEFREELASKQKALIDEYMKKIADATRQVAKRRGYSLVVDKGSNTTIRIVLYNQDSLDITDEVIKEFDQLYK